MRNILLHQESIETEQNGRLYIQLRKDDIGLELCLDTIPDHVSFDLEKAKEFYLKLKITLDIMEHL